MFYNPQHQNSSPGIAHKLSHPTHDPSAMWGNARPPGPPPNGQPQPPQTQPNASGRAPSPATYGMIPYTNGAVHHGQMHHHQHHNSITTYTSPSSLSQPRQGDSPASVAQPQPITNHHWQQQLLKAELCRSSSAPHHRARASALATRNSAKSAIPITNPNAVKVPSTPTENGSVSGLTDEGSTATESSAANGRTVVAAAAAATAAAAAAAARPTAPKTEERAWTTLDMGGMRLKILSPGLWNFTYLTTLYLNHNNLTSIPPEISQLRSLIVLDLTGNQLMSVPVELGMLTAMRELYLFDNLITTLPPELGSMHHLEMIGIEGNPMDATLRNIVQKDGTAALISYLRDSCPVPHPPPERLWRYMMSDLERKALDADPLNESFTVLNYNILCERCATTQLYGYTPSWALSWEYRKELILTEIMNYDADILCLQEVDVGNYEDYFKPQFAAHDYESVYWPKARANTMKNEEDRRRVDGCAIFFRSKKFQLVDAQLIDFARLALSRDDIQKTDSNFNRVFVKDHIAVVAMLENKASGSKLIVANAHIHWDPEFSDVKLVQVAILMDEVDKFAKRLYNVPSRIVPAEGRPPPPTYSDPSKIPMIVSGDYNSVPETGVYQFLSTGSVPKDHPDFLGHDYGKFAEKQLSHKMGLKSAYSHIGEPAVTNYTPSYQGVLDYIFYATTTLTLNAVLGEVDGTYLSKVVGFPNAHFPSDHICIMGDFRVRLPPKEIQPGPPGIRQPFPPPSGTPK